MRISPLFPDGYIQKKRGNNTYCMFSLIVVFARPRIKRTKYCSPRGHIYAPTYRSENATIWARYIHLVGIYFG